MAIRVLFQHGAIALRGKIADDAKMRELKDRAGKIYFFERVHLRFGDSVKSDVFSCYKKTLSETLKNPKYKGLNEEATFYLAHASDPLGEFLLTLKRKQNFFYKKFLNPDGDRCYSHFKITDTETLKKKGVYAWYVSDELCYIGKSQTTMKARVNQGYGQISPKNCYLDGQHTNCRVNANVTQVQDKNTISLWLCPLERDGEIESAERQLIGTHNPPWNKQGC